MKPTTAELDRRIEEVKQALITAMPRYAIVRNMAERYGVAERTADNYIAKAKTALKVEHEADRPYLMAEHVTQPLLIPRGARPVLAWWGWGND